jgi:hypothetical protein
MLAPQDIFSFGQGLNELGLIHNHYFPCLVWPEPEDLESGGTRHPEYPEYVYLYSQMHPIVNKSRRGGGRTLMGGILTGKELIA